MRVLLVDDDEDSRELLTMALEGREFVVTQARSVSEAIALGRASAHDVLVIDLTLPDGEGVEVVRALSPEGSPPAIALSGRDPTGAAAPFALHLVKPIGVADLAACLVRVTQPK
jgi:DNA-binding response OmpR family regulator